MMPERRIVFKGIFRFVPLRYFRYFPSVRLKFNGLYRDRLQLQRYCIFIFLLNFQFVYFSTATRCIKEGTESSNILWSCWLNSAETFIRSAPSFPHDILGFVAEIRVEEWPVCRTVYTYLTLHAERNIISKIVNMYLRYASATTLPE